MTLSYWKLAALWTGDRSKDGQVGPIRLKTRTRIPSRETVLLSLLLDGNKEVKPCFPLVATL